MMRTDRHILPAVLLPLMALALVSVSACHHKDDPKTTEADTRYWVNQFAHSMMDVYYLWNAEIKDGLESWGAYDDPVAKVREIRYKDDLGNDIDKWTAVYDDYSSLSDSFQGTSVTRGLEVALYRFDSKSDRVVAVVCYVSKDSPAEKAGIRRGDVISALDGEELDMDNYVGLVTGLLSGTSPMKLTFLEGLEASGDVVLTPVRMYEDPVMLHRTFDCSGKKVGYLVYNSFTQESCKPLVELCRSFRNEGVSELVLDLRYNPGGYVITEECLASMLAPESAVSAGSIFEMDVYNANLTKEWGDEPSCFKTDFTLEDGTKVSTADANVGLEKIYAIIGSGSASASESILVGLGPYIPIVKIGEQTRGKYCSGILYSTDEFYESVRKQMTSTEYGIAKKCASNWGIYVMIGRYADRDGNTPCMPDGFMPDVPVDDNPMDGCQLGDPQESMLKAALTLAGYDYGPASSPSERRPLRGSGPAARLDLPVERHPSGRILGGY